MQNINVLQYIINNKFSLLKIFRNQKDAQYQYDIIINDCNNLSEYEKNYYNIYASKLETPFNYNVDRTPFNNQNFRDFINEKCNQLFQYCTLSIYSTPFINGYFKLKLLSLQEKESAKLKSKLNDLISRQPLIDYQQLYKSFFGKEKESNQVFEQYIEEFEQCKTIKQYYQNEYKLCISIQGDDYKASRIQFLSLYLTQIYPQTAQYNKIIALNLPPANQFWTQNLILSAFNQKIESNMFQTYIQIQQNNLNSEDYILLAKAFQLLKRQTLELQLEYQLFQESQSLPTLFYLLNSAITRSQPIQIENIVNLLLQKPEINNYQNLEKMANQFIINNQELNKNLAQRILQICPYSIIRRFIFDIDPNIQNLLTQCQNIILESIYYDNWNQNQIRNICYLFQQIGIKAVQSLRQILEYPNEKYVVTTSDQQIIIPEQIQQLFIQNENLYLQIEKVKSQISDIDNFSQQQKQTLEFPDSYSPEIRNLLSKIIKSDIGQEFWLKNIYDDIIDLGTRQSEEDKKLKQQDSSKDYELGIWLQVINTVIN